MENTLHNRSLELLDKFINSPEGDAYFEQMKVIREIQKGRYVRFEEWLKHNDFDKLLYRLILEHGDDYREKCYHKGYEPHQNNKLAFIFDYIVHHYEPIEVPQLDSGFSNQVWFFRGYYFQLTYGQGTITQIYNRDDMRQILAI